MCVCVFEREREREREREIYVYEVSLSPSSLSLSLFSLSLPLSLSYVFVILYYTHTYTNDVYIRRRTWKVSENFTKNKIFEALKVPNSRTLSLVCITSRGEKFTFHGSPGYNAVLLATWSLYRPWADMYIVYIHLCIVLCVCLCVCVFKHNFWPLYSKAQILTIFFFPLCPCLCLSLYVSVSVSLCFCVQLMVLRLKFFEPPHNIQVP